MAAKCRVVEHLTKMGLPTQFEHLPPAALNAETMLELMRQDKKMQQGAMNLILAHNIGEAFIAKAVDQTQLLAFLTTKLPG